jgi:glycosyltransferase involved in cell wall biosynthesis
MISFIVIGKNEGKTLGMTFRSIREYVKYNNLKAYEIIYVDSQSTDDSIEIAKSFNEVKVFEITGEVNPAIGRNIGALEAKGDVFIFLDADMEIEATFHSVAFPNGKLEYPFISGQLKNIFYNKEWKKVDENYLFANLQKDHYYPTTGGYFIITKELWFSVGGMDTRFKRSQDMDLGLRLAKNGVLLLRKKELFVKHHTVHYLTNARMWKMLFNGNQSYTVSLLYRKHLFNKYIYKLIMRQNYTMVLLFLVILLSIFISPYMLSIYFIAIVFRGLLQKRVKEDAGIVEQIIHLFLRDLFSLVAIFCFFPKEKALKYEKV